MRTKIIATIGPKSDNSKTLSGLIAAGMDVARMNFSHCSYSEYASRIKLIATLNKKFKTSVTIMQDLQGPRIRVGILPAKGIDLKEGLTYTFTYQRSKSPSHSAIAISDPYLHVDISKGDPLFLANGDIELEVIKTHHKNIIARVTKGGILFSNKGINVPRTRLRTGALTQKDRADIRFALRHGVDFIALSFVQSADDIEKLRKLIPKKRKPVKIVAKIERAIALNHIDEIIQASDSIMVARGDLGIETPMEDLPIIQKNLVRHAHWHNTPAIIATQMMTSMITHHHPTRAEVSDIANAVFDGADALLLSDETAAGAHPVRSLEFMKRIVGRSEQYMHADNGFLK